AGLGVGSEYFPRKKLIECNLSDCGGTEPRIQNVGRIEIAVDADERSARVSLGNRTPQRTYGARFGNFQHRSIVCSAGSAISKQREDVDTRRGRQLGTRLQAPRCQ